MESRRFSPRFASLLLTGRLGLPVGPGVECHFTPHEHVDSSPPSRAALRPITPQQPTCSSRSVPSNSSIALRRNPLGPPPRSRGQCHAASARCAIMATLSAQYWIVLTGIAESSHLGHVTRQGPADRHQIPCPDGLLWTSIRALVGASLPKRLAARCCTTASRAQPPCHEP